MTGYCDLGRYDRATTGEYVRHRMKVAGASHELFTEEAITQVYEFSAGIPRVINSICTNALLYGCQSGKTLIDDHLVRHVFENELI